jgi:hypothetical protein
MSWLSKFLNKHTGLPEINLNSGKGREVLIAAITEELAHGRGAELIQKVPDATLTTLTRLCKDEMRRRLELDSE